MYNFNHSDIVLRHYKKNRTIVSSDILPMLQDISDAVGHELKVHKYSSGADIGTWIIPPQWDVKEAWLKGSDGKVVASYDDHPLFAVPYSSSFTGTVNLKTLTEHVRLHPKLDDVFFYEHRFAYNYQMRLKDWAITLPRNVLNNLSDSQYYVHLDFHVSDGEMIVGELCLPGNTDETIALLTDYCHPGQVNDSFSGILATIDVFKRLKALSSRKYTYRWFLFPETIGSAVLLHDRPDYLENTVLGIFSEYVGWGRNWQVNASMENDNPGNKLGRQIKMMFDDVSLNDLFSGYGNDELVFDFAGVPSMSVQMTECDEYHSSLDRPELIVQGNIDRAADIIYQICWMMENNRNLKFIQRVPVYLTRFDLYSDDVNEHENFKKIRQILYGIRDGVSLLDIATSKEISFKYVLQIAEQLAKNKLIE
ncbi:MAG: putative polysaccharide biosynthesis protein with aminopeptidase-like domain protein [Alphaproteobacteria bacterium MarineAlpha3_Bin5]|nr:hypothetical protein [Magnetovibrio sp.]PPR79558.1 MAG: putative polysaccharide biosynthesis protein with aminopeptidase-like domain protein [Alphaproteobacteria bacterium MarineAlpha3_Bin5]